MNQPRLFLLIGLAALAAGGHAAQEGGAPPPGGPNGFRGHMGPGGPGGPGLLMMPEVQKELNLTPDQLQKLRSLRPPQGQRQHPGEQDRKKHEAQLKTVLNDRQFQRFQEIQLQMEGPRALLRPDIAQKLGITADQRKQLEALRPAGPSRGRGPGGPPPEGEGGPPPDGQGGPPPDDRPEGGPPPGEPNGRAERTGGRPPMGRPGFMKEQTEKAMKVLTASQRAQWKAMLGKPLNLQRGGPPRPPQG